MCDAAGWESWSYDSRGHVVTERRNTNGVTKSTSYAYNLQGAVTSITYPSGRTISYTFNAAGQTTSASDVTNGITYASNAHYAAPGHLSSLQESGSNLIFTAYYNNRLQPCRISVKSSGTAPGSCTDATNIGNVLDFSYSFTSSSANNGNVASITNNRNTARSQTFTYDELNRISTAQSQATSGTYAWGLSFGYDPWANLLSATVTQGSATMLSVTVNGKNQVTNTGFAFDAAGNMTADGTNNYTFNAEGELTAAAGVTYTFDGDGNRVKKSSGKLYWYGVGSDPLSESDASGNLTAEYIFMSGTRIAMLNLPAATVSYYVQDHLGSSRVVTDSSGNIQDDSDFLPYGQEKSYSSSSGNHYRFTGKERDTESGLDDFAARFYASNYGRFISADDSKYMHPADPQTFNLYSYVANNPINAVDPTGHDMRDRSGLQPMQHEGSPDSAAGPYGELEYLDAEELAIRQAAKDGINLDPSDAAALDQGQQQTGGNRGAQPAPQKPPEPQIKVAVTYEKAPGILYDEKVDGKEITGPGTVIVITLTDKDGKPLQGTGTESISNPGVVTATTPFTLNSQGALRDTIIRGRPADRFASKAEAESFYQHFPINTTQQQTLTITSGKNTYQVAWTRTLSNLGADGKPGGNVTFTWTTPKVTIVQPHQ
jgi:RHS repeat-associated protein